MDRFVKPNQSSQQKNLGVEAIEDIIDVEHEIGFGEGEDWSREDATTSYGKLASRRTGPQKPTGYSRPHSNSPPQWRALDSGTKRWTQQNPAHALRHASSSPVDERASHPAHSVRRGDKPVDFPHEADDNNGLMEDTAENVITHKRRHIGGGKEDSKQPSQLRPQDSMKDSAVDIQRQDQSPQEVKIGEDHHPSQDEVKNEHSYRSPQANMRRSSSKDIMRYRGVPDSRENISRKHTDRPQRRDSDPKLAEMRQERSRSASRVRFSLDYETAQKLMGYKGARKSIDASEEENNGKKQEITEQDSKVGLVEDPVPVRPGAASFQRRKEPKTRDLAKDMNFDLERVIEMKEDKKAIRLAKDRIERLEEALLRQQEIVGKMRVALVQEGLKEYGKLRQLLDALEKNIRKLAISRSRHFSESYELRNRADQVDRLKAHCNMLETDRERMKKKLENLLESAKEKEKELAALRVERDRLLEHKAKGSSEESAKEWEAKLKKVEASFTEEKAVWEESLNACQLDWKDKKEKWAAELKEKEVELSSLKTSLERLVESLKLCRQGVDELKNVIQSPREDIGGKGSSGWGDGPDEEIDILELARSIYLDTESLKVLLQRSPLLLQEHKAPSELLEKNKVLDDKFSRTLQLTDRLKQDMERREGEIQKENAKYECIVAEKVREVDVLEKRLAEKEQGMDNLVKELKNEISLLSKELAQEHRERSQLSDVQEDEQQKLIQGLEKRKCEWEEEIEVLKGKLDEMSAAVALKDGRIDYLEDEVKAKAKQLAHEKQKWDSAIKEVKQRAAKTILRFVNGKENGLLEQLREQRKASKTSQGQEQTGSPYKADEETEDTFMDKEVSSLKDQIQNNKGYKQGRLSGPNSPRESTQSFRQSECEGAESCKSTKRKQDRQSRKKTDMVSAQADCMEEELSPRLFEWAGRNRGLDKQDVLDILERQKGKGNTTFALLQCTVQDLE